MLKGTERPTMAWVDGIPYSKAHFDSSWMTGGIAGLGSRKMSFMAWP